MAYRTKGTTKGTKLIESVRVGDYNQVNYLLNVGANPNTIRKWSSDGTKLTPLMVASLKGKLDIVKLLLERGADPNLKTNSGHTALFIASDWRRSEIIKLLLEAGADFDQLPIKLRKRYKHLRPSWQEICRYPDSEYNLKGLRKIASHQNIKNILYKDELISVSKAPKRLICLALTVDSQS